LTLRIEDYAMIGDMRTAALVGSDGSIDWFCCPRFDSGAVFAALLGDRENGRWQIAPAEEFQVHRRYRGASLVLETRFETASGTVLLTDFMPVGENRSSIVRVATAIKGTMRMKTDLVLRFDYGRAVPWVSRLDERTVGAIVGPLRLALHASVPLAGQDLHTVGEFTLQEGESASFTLMSSPSHLSPPLIPPVEPELDQTMTFWEDWTKRTELHGEWAEQVLRSLITLKGLSYRPTGGIVAAPTTSLPESVGSTRNWDYRFCWLRDATFTLLAFINAGHFEEAEQWQSWLLRAVAGSPEQIQTLYGVAGERRLDETEIPWLDGYEGSKPVRIGNAAATQFQLDIFGELADVMYHARLAGFTPPFRRDQLRKLFLHHVEENWRNPDEGIWEVRAGRKHFVHSKAMAWVAFDRAQRAAGVTEDSAEAARLKRIADEIHADVCANGIDPERGCFVQHYGSKNLDAACLLLPIVGFLPASDPRIKATVAEIEKRLMVGGLVLRYGSESGVDGLPAGEGAFLACSFWLVDNYLLAGHTGKARTLYRRLLALCNDVGLLAEEYDPRARRMLGNFPQAFSHVALVNSGLNLMHAARAQRGANAKPPR